MGEACGILNNNLREHVWRVNALLAVNDILVAIIVGIGAYGHRYRHRRFTRYLYDGATYLFLPIMSFVVSDFSGYYVTGIKFGYERSVLAECDASAHTHLVLIWTGLVQIVGINTSVIVSTDDREGRNITLPVILFVQAIWTSYLTLYNLGTPSYMSRFQPSILLGHFIGSIVGYLLLPPFVIILAKMIVKLSAFLKVRRSFALGRNPRLIVGYMKRLQAEGSKHTPPPLVVMGERNVQVENHQHGYRFNWITSNQGHRTRMISGDLVTIDDIWKLDDMLQVPATQLKDLCLSFALFKMLRCRFARYSVSESGLHRVSTFFWHELIKHRNDGRVLRVIMDELSFLYDYYYTFLRIAYPNRWPLIWSISISLLSMGYCLFLVTTLIVISTSLDHYQLRCETDCNLTARTNLGSVYFDLVPVILLVALVMLTEAREIATYICCNWTKVSLVCHFINDASWQQSPRIQKWVRRVLGFRCKLFNHWQDKMNQCSIVALHQGKTPVALLRRLIGLPHEKKSVKMPSEVKTGIINTLRRHEGSNGVISLCRSLQVGDFHWDFNGKSIADTMLVCHIATSIFEVRHPHTTSDSKIIATHLSRYCAYLVAFCPELLPEDDTWCKSFFKDVKKDAENVLTRRVAAPTPEAEFLQLIKMLSVESNHEVLRNGAWLAEQLVDSVQRHGEGTEMVSSVWEVLAGFWSEMILYVAPSENLDGHVEAIARGGELITLLWALLAHLGVVSRADAATTDAPAPASV